MGWRDCVSPEQEAEIDYLSEQARINKEKDMDEWENLIRNKKTNLSLHDWLQQNK